MEYRDRGDSEWDYFFANYKRIQRAADTDNRNRKKLDEHTDKVRKRLNPEAPATYDITKRTRNDAMVLACPECKSLDMERNEAGGYFVCCLCGAVSTEQIYGDGWDPDLHKYRESAPYNSLYHLCVFFFFFFFFILFCIY